jgi:hypothetical protein
VKKLKYITSSTNIKGLPLKGWCHEIEDRYTGFQVIDLKNLGLPEHFFRQFRVSFHDLLLKHKAAAVSY